MMQQKHDIPVVRNRVSLILVLAVALVPIGLSYLLYYLYQGEKPWGMTNHGELLDPVINVTALGLQSLGSDPISTSDPTSDVNAESDSPPTQWQLMLLAENECKADCAMALKQMKALQILLGKDADRVKPVLVLVQSAATQDSASITASRSVSYPELELKLTRSEVLENGLYIVDPLGNIILYFPYADVGKPVLTDLKKLLKVSQIG